MRTIMIACAIVLGVVSLGSVSAGNDKLDICHFQEENDSWKLLSLPQLAAAAHLEHHDDALPGGTTPQTGTVLDADCEEVEITCPCATVGTAVELNELFLAQDFEGEARTTFCVDFVDSIIQITRVDIVDDFFITFPILSLRVWDPVGLDPGFCWYEAYDARKEPLADSGFVALTPEENEACREDVRLLQEQLGCP